MYALQVEMLRVKMEGMSNGMRERMAEYSRRLEAVAGGDNNAGCQSRKCGGRHSRKPSACSQRSWSGSSNASNTGSAAAAFRHSGTSVASEKHQQQQQQQKVGFKLVAFKFVLTADITLFRHYVQNSATSPLCLSYSCFLSRTRLARVASVVPVQVLGD
jgi:hypothetical protein